MTWQRHLEELVIYASAAPELYQAIVLSLLFLGAISPPVWKLDSRILQVTLAESSHVCKEYVIAA